MNQLSMQTMASDPYAGTPMAVTNHYIPSKQNSNFKIAAITPLLAKEKDGKRRKLIK